jgi:hypothetical protein
METSYMTKHNYLLSSIRSSDHHESNTSNKSSFRSRLLNSFSFSSLNGSKPFKVTRATENKNVPLWFLIAHLPFTVEDISVFFFFFFLCMYYLIEWNWFNIWFVVFIRNNSKGLGISMNLFFQSIIMSSYRKDIFDTDHIEKSSISTTGKFSADLNLFFSLFFFH